MEGASKHSKAKKWRSYGRNPKSKYGETLEAQEKHQTASDTPRRQGEQNPLGIGHFGYSQQCHFNIFWTFSGGPIWDSQKCTFDIFFSHFPGVRFGTLPNVHLTFVGQFPGSAKSTSPGSHLTFLTWYSTFSGDPLKSASLYVF